MPYYAPTNMPYAVPFQSPPSPQKTPTSATEETQPSVPKPKRAKTKPKTNSESNMAGTFILIYPPYFLTANLTIQVLLSVGITPKSAAKQPKLPLKMVFQCALRILLHIN
jgi:hypothetical protein